MKITVEWEHMERRRTSLEVPDDTAPEKITSLADQEAHKGRAGRMDEILADAIGHVSWKAPDGRFGGRVR